jgi:hypothetical protein
VIAIGRPALARHRFRFAIAALLAEAR